MSAPTSTPSLEGEYPFRKITCAELKKGGARSNNTAFSALPSRTDGFQDVDCDTARDGWGNAVVTASVLPLGLEEAGIVRLTSSTLTTPCRWPELQSECRFPHRDGDHEAARAYVARKDLPSTFLERTIIDYSDDSASGLDVSGDCMSPGSPGPRFWNRPGYYEYLAQYQDPKGNGLLWLMMKTPIQETKTSKLAPNGDSLTGNKTVTVRQYRITVAQIKYAIAESTKLERNRLTTFEIDVIVPGAGFVRADSDAEKGRFDKNFASALDTAPALISLFSAHGIPEVEQDRLVQALVRCPVTVFPASQLRARAVPKIS
jgi:hypothetical protein